MVIPAEILPKVARIEPSCDEEKREYYEDAINSEGIGLPGFHHGMGRAVDLRRGTRSIVARRE